MNTTMNTAMSYFRLFDLPLDLLELLTLYFEGKEAVKLLTVSSDFHDIFARSVWHTVTSGTIDVTEPTRSSAYARYGHLVRSIDLFGKLNSDFDSHNWAQLFPNTTSMIFDIISEMEDDDKQTFMDAIASLHGLRSLEIQMDTNMPPFDLETLTTTLVARHRDPSKQSLQELIMFFGIGDEDEKDDVDKVSWIGLSSFVQKLTPLRPPINLQIDTTKYFGVAAPTPAQMDILRPHLIGIPPFEEVGNEDGCTALRNRQLFSPVGTRGDPLVFSRLHELVFHVCCASPHLFDYSDFTPTKFPVMNMMDITGKECSHQSEDGADSAIQTLVLQQWPKLKDLNVRDSWLTHSTMDELIELNPQFTRLNIGICRNSNGTDGVFMLERVVGRLPHLTALILCSDLPVPMDSSWLQATSLVDIRSSKLTCVLVSKFTLTPRLFEVLLALPNLYEMAFRYCAMTESELVMNVLKKHRQTAREDSTVGIRRLIIHVPMANNNWSNELVFEMIASLPRLESCRIFGDAPLKNAIKEKYPKLI